MAESDGDTGELAADPRIGLEVAGRYRIVSTIGRGGMGTVYEIVHRTTSKHFALKTLLPEMGAIGELAQRFEREARAQSRLSHPNIVQVSDFGTLDDGTLFYVMELVKGTSLGDLVEKQKIVFEPARALTITRRALEGLAHAHAAGVIHRDLKPDNIMLVHVGDLEEERDLVKLVDFGIAKLVGDAEADVGGGDKLTQAGVAFGTPDYMAPEQALGEPIDGRADLYSMGVILFEMLTGRKPFESEDKLAVVRMQVAVQPPSLAAAAPGRRFSSVVEKLVARALEKRREDRFASCEAMIAAIDAIDAARLAERKAVKGVGGAPTLALRSTLERVRQLSQPMKIALAVGAAFILLVVLAFATAGDRPKQQKGSMGMGMPTDPARPLKAPALKTELAAHAETMLAGGDAEGVTALLERELAVGQGLKDAYGHLYLGHARYQLERDVEALAAYDKALELGDELSADATLQRNVGDMVDARDRTVAMGALDLAGKMRQPGEAIVVRVATSKTRELRLRARELAEKMGAMGKVDKVESYGLDLKDAKTCPERKEVVPKLRALRDKRAIPLLKKAKHRGGGWFGLSDVNQCLEADAEEAIQFLESLP